MDSFIFIHIYRKHWNEGKSTEDLMIYFHQYQQRRDQRICPFQIFNSRTLQDNAFDSVRIRTGNPKNVGCALNAYSYENRTYIHIIGSVELAFVSPSWWVSFSFSCNTLCVQSIKKSWRYINIKKFYTQTFEFYSNHCKSRLNYLILYFFFNFFKNSFRNIKKMSVFIGNFLVNYGLLLNFSNYLLLCFPGFWISKVSICT